MQIAEQIWVEVCLRYRSDAVLARLRGQADTQWHLARRLQEWVFVASAMVILADGCHFKHFSAS